MTVPALSDIQRSGTSAFAAGSAVRVRQQFRAYTDCITNVAENAFSYSVSGTGAAFSTLATGADNAVGIMRAALGTTATGRAAINSVNFGVLRFSLGQAYFEGDVRIVSLSDATNTYTFRAGFIDSITGESTDGAFFRYTHGTNSGRFQAVTRSNGVETATDTGITVAANTWYDFEITVNAAGTSVEFKINGSVVATNTTNIPTASGRETGYGVMALRSVGTAAFNCYDCDFIEVTYDFTTAR
jgi:hypothetical protein